MAVDASSITIINRALALAGLEPFNSVEEANTADSTGKAGRVVISYNATRLSICGNHHWNCLTKRAILAPDAEAPEFGYAKQFTLPQDWLLNRKVLVEGLRFNSSQGTTYILEGRKLLTGDVDKIQLIYVADIDNTDLYDPLLREAIAFKLAADSITSIKQSKGLKDSLAADAAMMLAEARNADSKNTQKAIYPNHYLMARRGVGVRDFYNPNDLIELYNYYG